MTEDDRDDLLSDILSTYQLRAAVIDTPTMCGGWQLTTAGENRAAFHWVGEGSGWLHVQQGAEPMRLQAGDLVIFPRDAWHMVSGEKRLRGTADHEVMEGDGPVTTLVCGYLDFISAPRNALLEALPDVLMLRGTEGGDTVPALGSLLLQEARNKGVGRQAVLDKLSDALFVLALREHLRTVTDPRGLIAALIDPRLRRVLGAMHREPQTNWSLESLARLALMSRTAFAQQFAERVGQTPMQYLAHHRMMLAACWLRDGQSSVKEIAGKLGYETEAAFRRAFKRIHGSGPGTIRRGKS